MDLDIGPVVGEIRKKEDLGSFEWKIKDFRRFFGKFFRSPLFHERDVECNLCFFRNKTFVWLGCMYSIKTSSSEEDVLQENQSETENISIGIQMTIKIKESQIYKGSQKLIDMSHTKENINLICVNAANLLEYESDRKTLTVTFTIHPAIEEETTEETSKNNNGSGMQSKTGIDILVSNMEDLYLKGENCDFTIKVKDRDFQVHKAILSARSPVLAAMLHHDMSEKNSSATDIVDCEPEVFEQFLHYLYGGRVGELSGKNVIQLYTLGDKYDLEHLRKECVEFMKGNMCIDAFCDTISLAVNHKEWTLVKCAEEFFLKNVKNILVTTKWQLLLRECPDICNELFLKCYQ